MNTFSVTLNDVQSKQKQDSIESLSSANVVVGSSQGKMGTARAVADCASGTKTQWDLTKRLL